MTGRYLCSKLVASPNPDNVTAADVAFFTVDADAFKKHGQCELDACMFSLEVVDAGGGTSDEVSESLTMSFHYFLGLPTAV